MASVIPHATTAATTASASALSYAVINALLEAIAVLDQTGTIVAVNQAWEALGEANGANPADTGIGVNYLAVCRRVQGPEAALAQAALAGIQAVIEGAQPNFTLEYSCHSAQAKRWFLMQVTPLPATGGAVVIHADVTERHAAVAAVAQEHTLLRTLIDHLPDYIFVKDLAGRYVLVNQAYADFLGAASPEAVAGKSVFDFYPPELAAKYHADDLLVLREGQTLSNYEEPTTDRTGALQFHLATKTPLHNAAGVITGLVGIGHDITDRRHMIEALRQSEARNRALIEAIPDAIARFDQHGVYQDVKAPSNFQPVQPPTELVGQKLHDVLPQAMADKFLHFNDLARATGMLQLFEYEALVDQELRMREARIVPINQDEVIAILRDITARKQAESEKARLLNEVVEQRAQLRALTARLAEVQEAERKEIARELHDLVGQNLAALGLSLKLIQTQIPATLATGQHLKEQLRDALTLVTQTTSFIRTLMAELRPPVLDDYGLLAALRWYSGQIAQQSGVKIEVDDDEAAPRLPEAIENALFRIAQEALINIVKHARATVAAVTLSVSANQVALTITDNGQGFDPDAVATASQSSWGLLNMRERAEAIGGHCQIIARPGAGVTVQVEVPR
ncbi:MAG: PAS domain S-box protein [Caldilinea sp. CFX5]|nr:PAS domain S-box protein [Caldilinea sp. CFX5]